MGGEFGGEWIPGYVWLSPFPVHPKLTVTTLLIGCTPIQNRKFKKKLRNQRLVSCRVFARPFILFMCGNFKSLSPKKYVFRYLCLKNESQV